MALPRLRQAVLVVADLEPAAKLVHDGLGLAEPFRDPGVAEFGLHNAVFAVGDTFLELVSPVSEGTTAGRFLDRLGDDGGYMAIFQVPDAAEARRRIAGLGVRVVWQADLPDISGTHLHPKDVPGAIVSIDAATPPESWRWGGPAWTGRAPATTGQPITGLTVGATDPAAAASKWAGVLGLEAGEGNEVHLPDQVITFVPARTDAIVDIAVGGNGPSLTFGRATIRRNG